MTSKSHSLGEHRPTGDSPPSHMQSWIQPVFEERRVEVKKCGSSRILKGVCCTGSQQERIEERGKERQREHKGTRGKEALTRGMQQTSPDFFLLLGRLVAAFFEPV